jgi:hypothetical protein
MVIKVAVERTELMSAFLPLEVRFFDLSITVGKSLGWVTPLSSGLHVVCAPGGLTLEEALAVFEAEAMRRDADNAPGRRASGVVRVHPPVTMEDLYALASEFQNHVRPRVLAVARGWDTRHLGAGVFLLPVDAPTSDSVTLAEARARLVEMAGLDPATTAPAKPVPQSVGPVGGWTSWGGTATPSGPSAAYREGEQVGYWGRPADNPHEWGSRDHAEWSRGKADGEADDD